MHTIHIVLLLIFISVRYFLEIIPFQYMESLFISIYGSMVWRHLVKLCFNLKRQMLFHSLVLYIYFKSSIVYLTELSVGLECIFSAGEQAGSCWRMTSVGAGPQGWPSETCYLTGPLPSLRPAPHRLQGQPAAQAAQRRLWAWVYCCLRTWLKSTGAPVFSGSMRFETTSLGKRY